MPGDMLDQSIAYGLLELLQNVSGYQAKINSPTDDLTEDEALNFGAEELKA